MYNKLRREYKKDIVVQAFGEYDILRKDAYKDLHNKSEFDINYYDIKDVCEKYDIKNVDYEKVPELVRDYNKEQSFFNKVIKYLNFEYTIITKDEYAFLDRDFVFTCNIIKLFPKNKNMFNLLTLIENANTIIVGDDQLGMFLHFIATKHTFRYRKIVFCAKASSSSSSTIVDYYNIHELPKWSLI